MPQNVSVHDCTVFCGLFTFYANVVPVLSDSSLRLGVKCPFNANVFVKFYIVLCE